jgi:hypothetical protein
VYGFRIIIISAGIKEIGLHEKIIITTEKDYVRAGKNTL